MLLKKKRISVCYIDSSNLVSSVVKATEQLNKEYRDAFDMHIIPLGSIGVPGTREKQLRLMEEADLVLVDIRGTNPLIKDILEATRRGKATVASLLGGSFELMSLTRMGIFDANKFFNGPMFEKISANGGNAFANVTGETDFDDIDRMLKEKMPGFVYKDVGAWFEVTRYWGINGTENVRRLLIFMAKNYCHLRGMPKPLPPLKVPSPSIRHPGMEKNYDNLQDYIADYDYDPEKPTVVTVSYDGMHYENCLVPTTALIEALEPDVNVVPLFCDGMKNVSAVRDMVFQDGKFFGDLLVPLVWFRFNGGPIGGTEDKTYELFRKMNVPVFHPITAFTQTLNDWKENKQGVDPVEFLANVTLPECDGMVEPVILCGKENRPDEAYSPIVAIKDRAERCAGRIKQMLNLQRKARKDRKIALVVYNYPPGEHNIGNAAYLDTFVSVRDILLRMREEGYTIGDIPEDLSETFLQNNIVNSPEWSGKVTGVLVDREKYEEYLRPFPALKRDIEARFGSFPGKINVVGEQVILPCMNFGNITVALQPSRGFHEEEEQNYHDKSIPPHHQYAAFYRYLEETQDAVVHVGTHGTLEFLRGKEQAISAEDDMDMLLGDLPHFYIYQTGNPSEAMIAKRRTLATLISYSTPAADSSGLYGDYLAMRDLFDELKDADKLEPGRRTAIEEAIRSSAVKNDWVDLNGDLERIEARLTTMSRSLIPVGLHTFGTPMSDKEKKNLLTSVLRFDRGETLSLNRILAEKKGLNYGKLLEADSAELLQLDEEAGKLIEGWIAGEKPEPEFQKAYDFAENLLSTLARDGEMPGLINALDGGYADAGLSADSLRNPEVFPSGRNLYQFNPLTLPTPSALQRGRNIAKKTLELHREKTGSYPRSTGVVLWGFETAKTCGETVGQIFEYLGIRVKSEAGSWFPRIETVSPEELGHPRVDVTVEICGFFRDLFPNLVDIIDDAVRFVSDLDEEDNAVRERSLSVQEQLRQDGIPEQEAEELSKVRIFGPPESEYGTSLTTMIETGRWTDESELGTAFQNDMQYAYGRNVRGMPCPKVNGMLLSGIEMISQIQDTYEYDITDLDHYYEFFGGLSRAVENCSGRKPEMITTNTATEKIRTEEVQEAVGRGAASRTLNPKWIDAMLEHQYHGAQKIADRVQYQLGLSATTGAVDQWVWEKTAQTFVFDEEMRERLTENNRFAARQIALEMSEAKSRGYWETTPEEEEKLMNILMDYEEEMEGETT